MVGNKISTKIWMYCCGSNSLILSADRDYSFRLVNKYYSFLVKIKVNLMLRVEWIVLD